MSDQDKTERNKTQEKSILWQQVKIQSNIHDDNFNYFSILPVEIQYRIFESCELSELLNAARVCKTFRIIISDICQKRYQILKYHYKNFKYWLGLRKEDIIDLCCLRGEAVEIVRIISSRITRHLNFFDVDSFRENVKYFINLLVLEVEGNLLEVNMILKMAKHCKKLKTLRLFECDNSLRWSLHLPKLEGLEKLELKLCRCFEIEHLINTVRQRQLKFLSIVECEFLTDLAGMLKLSRYWLYLETLKLTACTLDHIFLRAIFDLPNLKVLQFYWIGGGGGKTLPLNFEENFFEILQEHTEKALSLRYIRFENSGLNVYAPLQGWTSEEYARMRESICINSQTTWLWSNEVFDKILKCFSQFKNLHMLSFLFCRLLNYEQLKQLSLLLKQLKILYIYGCPKAEDKLFQKQWLKLDTQCQLCFESFLTLGEVSGLYNDANSRSRYRATLMNSFECHF